MQNLEQNTLQLDNRKKLTMTGVISVDAFSPSLLRLTLEGSSMIVTGENLKVINFNKSQGNLIAEGLINEIKYLHKKLPLVKRFFK